MYGDITNYGEYQNEIYNLWFADIIEIYCGTNYAYDENPNYKYYTKAPIPVF